MYVISMFGLRTAYKQLTRRIYLFIVFVTTVLQSRTIQTELHAQYCDCKNRTFVTKLVSFSEIEFVLCLEVEPKLSKSRI